MNHPHHRHYSFLTRLHHAQKLHTRQLPTLCLLLPWTASSASFVAAAGAGINQPYPPLPFLQTQHPSSVKLIQSILMLMCRQVQHHSQSFPKCLQAPMCCGVLSVTWINHVDSDLYDPPSILSPTLPPHSNLVPSNPIAVDK